MFTHLDSGCICALVFCAFRESVKSKLVRDFIPLCSDLETLSRQVAYLGD